jgi:hypothetical protein
MEYVCIDMYVYISIYVYIYICILSIEISNKLGIKLISMYRFIDQICACVFIDIFI